MICKECQAWIRPMVDHNARTVRCPECGYVEPRTFLPLFIVTGPSGAGKTAVIEGLQRMLPDWEVFETDILWDSGGDWNMVKCNWLRIADSLAQRPHGRPTILCGTISPQDIEHCESRIYFHSIHWLGLVCAPHALATRLKARPAWRSCDSAFIEEQLRYMQALREQAGTHVHPALTLLDTTHISTAETVVRIHDWAVSIRELS